MTPIAIWDQDLSPSEWKKLKKTYGPIRIETSLLRKVEILELWATEGVPPGCNWHALAGSRTRLRAWHDPALKLWPWADDKPEKRPSAEPLMKRWEIATSELKRPKASSKTNEDALLFQTRRADALQAQVLTLIADKAWLEEKLLEARRKIGA